MHILCNSGIGAIPRADPTGLIVRCRRKAMGPREEPERARPARRSQSRKASHAVALDPGPRQPRRGQAGIARQGRAQGCARVREWAGCPSSEPRPDLADPQREARRARLPGGISFGYFSLCKQRKVTRSHGCERKNEGMRSEQNQKPQQKLDSSFRWNDELRAKTLDSGFRRNDERRSKGAGFRLPPE